MEISQNKQVLINVVNNSVFMHWASWMNFSQNQARV